MEKVAEADSADVFELLREGYAGQPRAERKKMRDYEEMMRDTFEDITQIGAGGGGTIFKAHHKRLDKDVVLKKIHVSQLGNISHRAELDILKELKHSYVPQIYDFIEYGNDVFTIMEYIPGKSFEQLLEQKERFSRKDIVKWFRQLSEVVEYLHSQKPPIIHCDIKPANVMLTPAGDICLIDFNISGVKSEEGVAAIGYSSGYAPVEQFAVVTRYLTENRKSDLLPEDMPGSGAERTELLPGSGAERTELLPGSGAGGTELLPGSGAERTELLPGSGAERTELLPGSGAGGTELLPGSGAECTGLLPGSGSGCTELLPRSGAERTELLFGSGIGRTELQSRSAAEVGPGPLVQPEEGKRKSGRWGKKGKASKEDMVQKYGKSPLPSMNDIDWLSAKRTEASIGGNLTVDEKTDIYGVGATMYHIITGQKPLPFYQEQVPLYQLRGDVTEGLSYVVKKAMALRPGDRFKNSTQLLKAVRNMATVDKRYRSLSRQQVAAAVFTGVLTMASVLSIFQGKDTMAQERKEQYRFYIDEMGAARERKDYETAYAAYDMATSLFEEEQDAYYEMAMIYYGQGRYEDCISYISDNVYNNSVLSIEDDCSRFYYITASCYFELEEYGAASSYYKRALELQPEAIAYYRDYVVALARKGEIQEAEAALREAEAKGVSGDILNLLNGEISLLQGDYQDAEKCLTECIQSTKDAYLKLRAYAKLDDVYQGVYEGSRQYDTRISLLTQALEALPGEYQVILMERLAQVYINYSDIGDKEDNCIKAISLFVQMEERGYATFTSRYNIAVLYEKIEQYEEAMTQLNGMRELYPDNYIVYKRMSFIELEVQAQKTMQERDYHTFQKFYEQAQGLYEENTQGEDMEMLSLQQLYNDVETNGWL